MSNLSNTATEPSRDVPDWAKGAVIGILAIAICQLMESAERRYNRGQLLAAYRRRREWKKSDLTRLQSLGVNKAAQSRMARLLGTGRPVVKPHLPMGELVVSKFNAFALLVDSSASVEDRKRAFREWPWWPHYVEALYRGEHEIAVSQDLKGPSNEAEIAVGNELGISAASVHQICGEIRRMRKEDEGSANFPSMTLNEYRRLMVRGFNE